MISERAYVHPDAKIGNNVTVEPFAYIAGDVVIGDDCWIGPGAVIHDGARIGKGCKIHTAASVSCLPQDLKFAGEKTLTIIGDYNDIRECVTISRGTASRGETVIGDHNLLMAYVHIAHDDVVGSHCVFANRVSLAGEVEVGDWAVIGGHVAVHQWVKLGAHVMIQGGALISQDVPPFIIVRGDDVRYAGINKIGLSRRGFSAEQISIIHDSCRILFQSGLNYMNGCDEVEKQIEQSVDRDHLLEFIRSSKRGIIKPFDAK
ncbi:MAG: acyl-ACP--UDP-N-acetylglucosamine O-acyltransferase [Rikenellaceae bacterium]